MDDCIFCKIVRGEIPSFTVYEDARVLAFADINPIAPGHTLVIPKAHAQDLWEITEEDLTAVHLASRRIIRGIKTALHPSGVACVQLNGRGANQVVLHYHLHLVPRVPGGPELPMASWELKEGDMGAIQETAARIAAAIKAPS
jgi:histidine triad (HIT) family protein